MLGNCFCREKPRFGGVFLWGDLLQGRAGVRLPLAVTHPPFNVPGRQTHSGVAGAQHTSWAGWITGTDADALQGHAQCVYLRYQPC